METNFATHSDPGYYNLRGILLFGAAEIMRSRICVDYLTSSKIKEFGRLMNISHDGDRVARPSGDGKYRITKDCCSDEYFNALIADLNSEDPDRVFRGQLYIQPGSYRCSTEQVDRMVDIACRTPGVVGAQIAGAGLGGCIMIMAEKNSTAGVHKALINDYYKPNKLKPAIMDCIVTEGAGLVEF